MPVERITDVVGNLLYGTMFTNYFTGQAKPVGRAGPRTSSTSSSAAS